MTADLKTHLKAYRTISPEMRMTILKQLDSLASLMKNREACSELSEQQSYDRLVSELLSDLLGNIFDAELLEDETSTDNHEFFMDVVANLDNLAANIVRKQAAPSNYQDATNALLNNPMPTANSDDALWALRAWGERYNHPELREHIGKWVAIYGFRVILSGDDPDDVTRRAVEACKVPDERITVEFWEE